MKTKIYIDKHLTKLTLSDIKNIEAVKYYYQNKARCYLSEYAEQKELRIHWFEKNHDKFKNLYTIHQFRINRERGKL